MTKERRLGRGLEALLGKVATQQAEESLDGAAHTRSPLPPGGPAMAAAAEPEFAAPHSERAGRQPAEFPENTAESPPRADQRLESESPPNPAEADRPARVDIRQIDSNPFQPRRDFGDAELDSLVDSLRSHGLLQPLVVRRVGERYQLVAGERRLRAAARAGWTEVPIQLIEADDRQTAELAIVENLQRKDLNALEKAASFQRYLDQYGATQEELAARLTIDRSTVANLIRLLELPDAVQQAVREGRITPGHARALLPLGDEREQIAFCQKIHDEALSVRKTETLVQETIRESDGRQLRVVGEAGAGRPMRRVTSEHVAALEQTFRAALGLRVAITHNSRGRGKLVVYFGGHDDFARLQRQICGVDQEELRNQAG
ncbi:MAG: ParB/RepB/Spo0J family partition protein [Pirellulales bacterium]|nr:ParB/RepB/Spo0J family partition protein [Thermoguttaceae bacterium]MDD4785902.1 ParB/RepB/Spo0J family partition protein [Pirellulales bacterium]MDI9446655.1 ParB/RepB/Spo0J family partition protein [Planctomycetota bacterium]NLZ02113.1 ParB/RepB/Spo0J family partition protein [Pirellulaceae bacterium]